MTAIKDVFFKLTIPLNIGDESLIDEIRAKQVVKIMMEHIKMTRMI